MLVSENRPEWLIADLGIMAAGCVTVPTYTTNTTRDHQHILGNSRRRGGDRLDPETGQGADPGGAVRIRLPPRHRRSTTSAPASRRTIAKFHVWTDLVAGAADVGALEQRMAGGRPRRPRLPDLHQRHRRRAARRACSTTARSSTISTAASTSSPTTSAGTTRCSCRSCPPATPMSIAAASISRSRSARRSITPKASRSSPPISRKCARRSWSSCRGCSRCCARGS